MRIVIGAASGEVHEPYSKFFQQCDEANWLTQDRSPRVVRIHAKAPFVRKHRVIVFGKFRIRAFRLLTDSDPGRNGTESKAERRTPSSNPGATANTPARFHAEIEFDCRSCRRSDRHGRER